MIRRFISYALKSVPFIQEKHVIRKRLTTGQTDESNYSLEMP